MKSFIYYLKENTSITMTNSMKINWPSSQKHLRLQFECKQINRLNQKWLPLDKYTKLTTFANLARNLQNIEKLKNSFQHYHTNDPNSH